MLIHEAPRVAHASTKRNGPEKAEMTALKVPTIDDVLAPYRHLPKLIQTAILRVETHPSFSILTRSTRKVLKDLITRVSKTDAKEPIRARLDLVAERVDVSYKTVVRAMSALRQLGWISEIMQSRSEFGLFTSGRYQLSPALCELIDLPYQGKAPPASSRETEMSYGAVYDDLSFKKDQQKDSAQKRKTEQPSPAITLPKELEAITAVGIKQTGIARLRGLAHRAGYRLEDIWVVARQRIAAVGAVKGRAYRYLERLIQTPSDYAQRAAQHLQAATVCDARHREADKARKYANRRYAGEGHRVRIFECGTRAEVVTGDGRYVDILPRDIGKLYTMIEKGRLKEIVV